MKLKGRVRRRDDGSFQAMVMNAAGVYVWACPHKHSYGTSNRVKQDSASKCAHQQVLRMREEDSNGSQKAAHQEASQAST